VGEDGSVTVFTGKVEVGQDIRTSLSQVVADELTVPLEAVRLVMGDTSTVPFDMGTFGSRTTPVMGTWLRKVAAAAREMLVDLVAEDWKVDRSALVVDAGRLREPAGGRSSGFGEIARGRRLAKAVAESTPTKPAKVWTVAGSSVPRINGRAIVTGGHQYASDIGRPGLLHGKVLRPPSIGATLESADIRKAEALSGVTVVKDGSFVGVAAETGFRASQALALVEAKWATVPQPSHQEIFDYLRSHREEGRGGGGRGGHVTGSMREGFDAAEVKLEGSYTAAYIAHAPLEPRAAVAEWEGERLTVWTGTQRPFGVRSEVARAFGMAEASVRVIVPDTGSGYGGKHSGEVAVEAARLAKAAGRPVKVVWTREEEFTGAYFRPAAAIDVRSGARKDGSLTAWAFHNFNSGAAALRTPYEVPNQEIAFHPSRSPLRQGSYRALAATANNLARESHMDELARALGIDPLAFRLLNLRDERLQAVLKAAAERFGWGQAKVSKSMGFGLAGGTDKGGYVATCAEVRIQDEQVEVVRLVTAFECGAIINPDNLRNQVEGAVVMGLGGALFEAVEFTGGKIQNPRFSGYRLPRFSDVPLLETVLLDRRDVPSAGAGETPIIAVAPAIGNAIFDASGIRLRSLPLVPRGLPH
jgi:isoquinoline 1-oxidoreductase